MPIVDTNSQRIQNSRRLQSPPNSNNGQNSQSPPFSTILISHSTQVLNFGHSVHYSGIGPQSVNSTQNNPSQTDGQRNCILCKNSTQRQEFSNKVRSLRQGHVTQAKEKEPKTKQRHSSRSSSKVFQSFCMSSIVLSSYAQELCWTCNSVSLHSLNRTQNTHFVHCKQCKYYLAHVGYTTISNKFFLIDLSQGCQTRVDHANQTDCTHPGPQISTCFRELIQVKTQQPISSLLQLHSGQLNTSSRAPLYVSFGQPQVQWHQRNFNSKSLEESPPQKQLTTRINRQLPQLQIVGGSCPTIQLQKTGKHCQRAYQSIKHQQIGSTYFSSTPSPQSNQLKHGQKCTLIEYVKTQQVQTCETSKLKTFQGLLQCIKRLTMSILSIPTTLNSQRHLNCSLQYHPKTLTIKPKFLFHCEQSIPACTETNHLLKRLHSSWYKTRPQTHAQHQSYQTKEQCIKTMLLAFFPWQYTKEKSGCLWLLLHCRKLTLQRDRQQQRCSQNTHTKHLRPHCFLSFLV